MIHHQSDNMMISAWSIITVTDVSSETWIIHHNHHHHHHDHEKTLLCMDVDSPPDISNQPHLSSPLEVFRGPSGKAALCIPDQRHVLAAAPRLGRWAKRSMSKLENGDLTWSNPAKNWHFHDFSFRKTQKTWQFIPNNVPCIHRNGENWIRRWLSFNIDWQETSLKRDSRNWPVVSVSGHFNGYFLCRGLYHVVPPNWSLEVSWNFQGSPKVLS